MLISKNWLLKYIPTLANTDDVVVSEKLTAALAEVEEIKLINPELSNLVCGEIVSIEAHPKSLKLKVCQVNIGNKNLQIVCGATNIEVEQKVVVCLAGGSVKDDAGKKKKITEAQLVGVSSQGMICSEKELGISDSHAGILVLTNNYQVGTDLTLIFKDIVFVIENKSLTHRGDCFSHMGIARELAAILNLEFLNPKFQFDLSQTEIVPLEVTIETKNCERLSVVSMKNIMVKQSPLWLKIALNNIGIRSINNIVDLSNYIMHDIGQPLHIYDYKQIYHNKLIVRDARSGEKITGLNHNSYILDNEDIVITDPKNIVSLAGIIGGVSSEITNSTTEIVIEAAIFAPAKILKTARKIGLRTDASIRFSKGIDPNLTLEAIKIALNLITDVAGGDVGSEVLDIYPEPKPPVIIDFDLQDCTNKLGINIPTEDVLIYLERLGLKVINRKEIDMSPNIINVSRKVQLEIPSWRKDLNENVDIIEEVIRLHGFDKLIPTLPNRDAAALSLPGHILLQREARKYILRLGYTELVSYSFFSKIFKDLFELKDKQLISITNAISPELNYLRPTLIISLLEAIKKNEQFSRDLNLFEIGRVIDASNYTSEKLPDQPWKIGLIKLTSITSTDLDKSRMDYLKFKGEVETFIENLGIKRYSWRNYESKDNQYLANVLHPYKSSTLVGGDNIIGQVGEISPKVINNFLANKSRVYIAEIDLQQILISKIKPEFKTISTFPQIQRDISFWISDIEKLGNLDQFIKSITIPDIDLDINLQDEYINPDKKKSVTFRINLQPTTKTATDEEANKIIESIIAQISKQFRIKLRVE